MFITKLMGSSHANVLSAKRLKPHTYTTKLCTKRTQSSKYWMTPMKRSNSQLSPGWWSTFYQHSPISSAAAKWSCQIRYFTKMGSQACSWSAMKYIVWPPLKTTWKEIRTLRRISSAQKRFSRISPGWSVSVKPTKTVFSHRSTSSKCRSKRSTNLSTTKR